MLKAIETVYHGYRFRSRLEARWAVFFNTLGWRWEYEKEGFEFEDGTRYLPDFWLPDIEAWVEVKGEITIGDLKKVEHLVLEGGHPLIIVSDFDWEPPFSQSIWLGVRNLPESSYLGRRMDKPAEEVGWARPGYSFVELCARIVALESESWQTLRDARWIEPDAIAAARGARFEHGENGTR